MTWWLTQVIVGAVESEENGAAYVFERTICTCRGLVFEGLSFWRERAGFALHMSPGSLAWCGRNGDQTWSQLVKYVADSNTTDTDRPLVLHRLASRGINAFSSFLFLTASGTCISQGLPVL